VIQKMHLRAIQKQAECATDRELVLMTNEYPTELPTPGIDSLGDPFSVVAPQLLTVFAANLFEGFTAGSYQPDTPFFHSLTQGTGIVATASGHAHWLLSWPASRLSGNSLLRFRSLSTCSASNKVRKALSQSLAPLTIHCSPASVFSTWQKLVSLPALAESTFPEAELIFE
jgi:hypothetical protein